MVLNTYGETATFEGADVEAPTVKPGHVVVRVAASSVNTVDTMIRSMGKDLPFAPDFPAILGMDFAGTIESVGDGVSRYAKGDEVYGCAGGLADLPGALAEFMLADVSLIAHKPKNISMRQAAALPLVAITAYEGLQRAGSIAGEKLLVHGGTGGVGHVAVQLAKHYGAEVFTTISNAADAAIVEGYGVTAINYKTDTVEDYVARYTHGWGFDVVYDSVGGDNLVKSFEACRLNAHVITTVSLLELDLTLAHFKGLSIHVVFMLIQMLHKYNRYSHSAILADISRIVDNGGLVPLLDEQRFQLHEVQKAYAHLSSGSATGKVVVEV